MNEFAGTVPFLRIALEFDMKTMHFYIAQTGLFLGELVLRIQGVTINNLAPMKNLSWDAR